MADDINVYPEDRFVPGIGIVEGDPTASLTPVEVKVTSSVPDTTVSAPGLDTTPVDNTPPAVVVPETSQVPSDGPTSETPDQAAIVAGLNDPAANPPADNTTTANTGDPS